jgi:Icc protein
MNSVRLLQFTDTHLLAEPHGKLRGAPTLPRLQACLAHAGRHCMPADAIALTGDIVQDDATAYGTVELLFADSPTPVLLIPGNHDVPDELQRRLGRAPFRVGGTHRFGAWTVVLLNSWFAQSVNGEGRLGNAQLQSLDATLAACRAGPALIMVHHPPIVMDTAGLDALRLVDVDALLQVLGRHPHVRGLVWGHAHQSLDVFRAGGLRLLCTPATCMQFRPRDPGFVVDDRPPGYRVIDLQDDGGIATEVVWLENYRD